MYKSLILILIIICIIILSSFKKQSYECFENSTLPDNLQNILNDIKSGKMQVKDVLNMQLSKEDMRALINYFASALR